MGAASNLPPPLSFPRSTWVPSAWRLQHQPMVFRRSCPPICRRISRSAYISPPVSDPNVGKVGDDRASSGPSFSGVASETAISWGLLWSLMSKQKLGLAVSFVSLLGCTTCTLSMPISSGRFFEVLVGKRTEPLLELLAKVGVLYVFEPVFTVIFVVNMSKIWEKVMTALRARVFRRILVQKVEFFDRYKVGELTGLQTSDLSSLKDVVSENILRYRGFRALSEVLGTICILFSLSTQLAPVLGFLVLSVSILVAVYKRSTMPVFKSHGMAQARISDCATETFSTIRTVRSFGGEKRQMSMFSNQILAYQASGMKLGTLKAVSESLPRIMVYVSFMALYFLGGNKVKAGELSVGIMASFIGPDYVAFGYSKIYQVHGGVNTIGDLRGTFAAIERINSVLSGREMDEFLAYGIEKDIQGKRLDNGNLDLLYGSDSVEPIQSPGGRVMSALKSSTDCSNAAWSGDICLEDVSFSYPLRSDVVVLNGLNQTLKCGKVTALVGPSGAGKSTIVQLLARFYDPIKGRITVAGEDVRTFDKSEWAQVMSIVNQEPVLFSVSVGENIAYGLPDENVSKEDVVKAAKAANAHEFIVSFPQGYDTLVGERGSLLCGGQRQRIAIARALLKNAPILILDEATSALDAVSERLVQNALNHLMKGRTTLVIAHRLSTVQNADQIAVCVDGRIVELGTHSELIAQNGQYASLVGTQRLAFK